jgi:Rrf2 family nitric oxide-sensitive transcriptional repressor
MRFTDHTDIGLRALILLGSVAPNRLSAQEISGRYSVSHSHVQKVIQSLEAAGFVRTYRGRGGGAELARLAEDITVGEVVRALEPDMHFVPCFRPGASECVLAGGCLLTQTMIRAKTAMLAELDRTDLAEIIRESPHLKQLVADAAPC